jgi:hypothetical protein
VAVIFSKGDAIDWCFRSESLKEAKGTKWLRKGTPVPAETVTETFNVRPENFGLGSYGRTFTVLTCKI